MVEVAEGVGSHWKVKEFKQRICVTNEAPEKNFLVVGVSKSGIVYWGGGRGRKRLTGSVFVGFLWL
ncbi:hypothetical protein Cflav_PD2216 [Pedosphaera parvula Ellin514]|uniref:Uncharacterized protein n=1 Tax=Pedosphaera parvula (strain Ellin514) TaxID=320771 RepID=B9XM95_PEDPL|nr:hypothetical protein Cflav_PD2216 [Pedosphaera parvula Ellin514]